MSCQALPAFFEIQQSHAYLCAIALADDSYKHMFGVEAAMLPAPQMHTRQGLTNRLKYTLMHRFTQAFAFTGGIPVVDLDKTVQSYSHQQCPPLFVCRLLSPAIHQFRYTDR